MRQTLAPDRLARLGALSGNCRCGHQGWVHTPDGCVGQKPSGTSQMQFAPCDCKVTTEQHIASLTGDS